MKKTLLYIAVTLIMLMSVSCTRNHGDIGPWFGTWHVESITADGSPVSVTGDYFFQFQSKVFKVTQVWEYEQTMDSYGTWEESGDKMTVSFPDTTAYYIVMPGLEEYNNFKVNTSSSREVTFTKSDTTGMTYAYRLKKQP